MWSSSYLVIVVLIPVGSRHFPAEPVATKCLSIANILDKARSEEIQSKEAEKSLKPAKESREVDASYEYVKGLLWTTDCKHNRMEFAAREGSIAFGPDTSSNSLVRCLAEEAKEQAGELVSGALKTNWSAMPVWCGAIKKLYDLWVKRRRDEHRDWSG